MMAFLFIENAPEYCAIFPVWLCMSNALCLNFLPFLNFLMGLAVQSEGTGPHNLSKSHHILHFIIITWLSEYHPTITITLHP